VRPEKVRLQPATGEPDGDVNAIRGTVIVSAFLGVSIQYVIQAAGGEELTVIAQNVDSGARDSLGAGQDVQLAWDPDHTFVVAKEDNDGT
jgi:spermidine/putrescine transport system ATP-binding protein